MSIVAVQERVRVEKGGLIHLPDRLRQASGIEDGDELVVCWLPPDQFLARRAYDWDDESLIQTRREFGAALKAAGYDTTEKVVELVRQVRREIMQERFAEQGLEWRG